MANRQNRLKVAGNTITIEQVPDVLIDAKGKRCGVVACGDQSMIYVAGDARPNFADGVCAGFMLALIRSTAGILHEPDTYGPTINASSREGVDRA